jgi:hypothetical protein
MIRVMIDSDVLDDIPAGRAQIVATYADLFTSKIAFEEFEKAHKDSIVVLIDRGLGDPLGLASVADVEPECLTAAQLPAWFGRKKAAGVEFLTVYSDRSDLDEIQAALKGTGHEDHWRWIATDDGTVDISGLPALRRPAAVQILPETMIGIHADLSLVLEDAWHGTEHEAAQVTLPA